MQGLVHSDHYLLGLVGAQTASVVERYVAELHQVRPLAQLIQVTGDAADLPLVAARIAVGAKDPAWRQKCKAERIKQLMLAV